MRFISRQAILAPTILVFIAVNSTDVSCTSETGYTRERTLRSDGAVECVTFDVNGFGSRLSVRLENVDRLDGIFDLASRVDSLDSEHSVDGHVGEEFGITENGVNRRLREE